MDNTKPADKVEDQVQTGHNVTLLWKLTADFAPKDDDPSCLPFAYHSHNNPDMEVNAGLLGLLLVCKQGNNTVMLIIKKFRIGRSYRSEVCIIGPRQFY